MPFERLPVEQYLLPSSRRFDFECAFASLAGLAGAVVRFGERVLEALPQSCAAAVLRAEALGMSPGALDTLEGRLALEALRCRQMAHHLGCLPGMHVHWDPGLRLDEGLA